MNYQTLAPKILKEIHSSKNILLHLHPSPDADSLGSALAFYWYLKSIGKNPTVIKGDSELPNYLSVLPGFDHIVPQNFFETNLKRFDLFISLDTSAPNQISKIDKIILPLPLKTIVIDHHQTNFSYGLVNLVDTTSPATAQIVYQLFRLWKVKMTRNVAVNLFVGIYHDTGGFKYQKTTADTFIIASELVKHCPDFTQILFDIDNSNLPQHLYFKGLALSNIKTYFNQKLAVSAISYKVLEKFQISSSFSEKSEISNMLKSVVGWDIGATIVERSPGVCTLSLRTRDSSVYDLSKVASSVGEGGGHPAAAGSTIYAPISKAVKILLTTVQQLHPDLGSP